MLNPSVADETRDDRTIRRCMDFGASGFIPKTLDVETMRQAVRAVLAGDAWTPPDIDLAGAVVPAPDEAWVRALYVRLRQTLRGFPPDERRAAT